jgi:hypothetical protein
MADQALDWLNPPFAGASPKVPPLHSAEAAAAGLVAASDLGHPLRADSD